MSTNTNLGMVVYTDGSAMQDTGDWGSGMHGYIYAEVSDGRKMFTRDGLIATTEGYILKKDYVEGKQTPVHVVKFIDGFESSTQRGTNNIGEMQALLTTISMYPKFAADYAENIKTILVNADSELVIKGVTQWREKWKRAGWHTASGAPVANVDRWKKIDQALEVLDKEGVSFSMKWVRGHNFDHGNTKADYLAAVGTNHSIDRVEVQQIDLFDPQGYDRDAVDVHPLLTYKRMYYNSDASLNAPGQYYMASWAGKEYIHGRRMGDVSYCILKLAEPDHLAELVIKRHTEPGEIEVGGLLYTKLDRLKAGDVQLHLTRYGGKALRRDRRCNNLVFADRKPVALEVTPGELPMRTVDTFSHLEDILIQFEKFCETGVFDEGSVDYRYIDITDALYDTVEKKRGKEVYSVSVLKKEFGVGVEGFPVEIDRSVPGLEISVKRQILFAEDLPTRNAMKRLESLEPKVGIVSWSPGDGVFFYAVVIKCRDCVGIWSNYFANQVFS